ncbi:MAG: hypothetical protein J3K34DRAFT_432983 [Monoraphidium minutum]|nr:MAG: hypothetical protein J3K34DRAFT_432983 [Monoraphidium minutum]
MPLLLLLLLLLRLLLLLLLLLLVVRATIVGPLARLVRLTARRGALPQPRLLHGSAGSARRRGRVIAGGCSARDARMCAAPLALRGAEMGRRPF